MAELFSKFLKFIGVEEDDEEEEGYGEEQEPTTQQPGSAARSYEPSYRYGQASAHGQQPGSSSYQEYSRPQPVQPPRPSAQQDPGYAKNKGGKVVQHPSYENPVKHQTTIYQISEHTETKAVIDDLLAGKSVLLNLENLDAVESQRVIDTLSGAAYAIAAKLRKAAHQTYYIAPANVEIGGNYADETKRGASSIFKGRSDG